VDLGPKLDVLAEPPADDEQTTDDPSANQPVPRETPAADQVGTYMLIRIEGTIGANFTARHMKHHLARAAELKPDVVVLYLDTPGGYITDAEEIINMLIQNNDLRFVAYVRRALSAGASITMTCPEIYVEDVAKIGAALCYQMVNGMPTAVEEKFQSSWRATCRKAADNGGHPSVLAEAMIDADVRVTMRTENGKAIVERDGNGALLSAEGRILTLTAREAVACGLAIDRVDDAADLQAKLGFAELTDAATGAKFSLAAAPDADPEDGSAAALFLEIDEKLTELGFDNDDMTTLQIERALEDWEDYLEDSVFGRRVNWTVSVLEVEEVDRDTIDEEIAYTRRQIMELEELVTIFQPDPQVMRDMRRWYQFQQRRIKRLKRTRSLARDYPYSVAAAAGRGDSVGCVIACIHKRASELIEGCSKGDVVVLAGEIEDLTFRRDLGEEIYPVLWIQKCRASEPETPTPATQTASDDADGEGDEGDSGQDDQGQGDSADQGGQQTQADASQDDSQPGASQDDDQPGASQDDDQDDEDAAGYILKIAKMYRMNGNLTDERDKLEEIIEKYPDTEAAADAAKRIKEQVGRGSRLPPPLKLRRTGR